MEKECLKRHTITALLEYVRKKGPGQRMLEIACAWPIPCQGLGAMMIK